MRVTGRSICTAGPAHRRLTGNSLLFCQFQHHIGQRGRRDIGGVVQAHLHPLAQHPLAANATLAEGIIRRRALQHNCQIRSLFQSAGTTGSHFLLHRADSLQRAFERFSGQAAHHLNHAVYPGAVVKCLAHPAVWHFQLLQLHIRRNRAANADSTRGHILCTRGTNVNEKRFSIHHLAALSLRQQVGRSRPNLPGNAATITRVRKEYGHGGGETSPPLRLPPE